MISSTFLGRGIPALLDMNVGSLNDINIWDKSPLLKSFLDGSFTCNVNFQFEIDGIDFDKP
jgi:hypothetical protein